MALRRLAVFLMTVIVGVSMLPACGLSDKVKQVIEDEGEYKPFDIVATIEASEGKAGAANALGKMLGEQVVDWVDKLDSPTGAWRIEQKPDPSGGSPGVSVWLAALGTKPEDNAAMGIRCRSNPDYPELQPSLSMLVIWPNAVAGESPTVTFRVGDTSALTTTWDRSTDKDAIFPFQQLRLEDGKAELIDGAEHQTLRLVKKLTQVDRFAVRVEAESGAPMTQVFDVRGLEIVIPSVLQGCGLRL